FDRRRADSPCCACLFPAGDADDDLCAVMGVFAPVTGVIGTLQAAEALKLAAGTGAGLGESLDGRLLLFDALTMTINTVRVPRDPHCAVCGDRALAAAATV
ncbi:MAG TPA: ThiF family adenylyltransferase, partial [Burkholderiaceae bacterium]|nr:ThiF family adenylyltransferase [Burkholderiaceae bacterium]